MSGSFVQMGIVLLMLSAASYGQIGGAPPSDAPKPPLYVDEVVNGQLTGQVIPWESLSPQMQQMLLPTSGATCTAGWEVTTLHESGPSANRMDIVFLGDGFTEALQDEYNNVVASGWQALSEIAPFPAYLGHINVYRVNVLSNDACIDDPSEQPPLVCDTPLRMGYIDGGGLMVWAQAFVDAAAACAPGAEKIIAYGRGDHVGGSASGDTCGVSSQYSASDAVTVHEIGHTIGDLTDEYVSLPGEYDGPEISPRNASIDDRETQLFDQTKWYRWMDVDDTDTHPGSGGYVSGLYRPNLQSRMGGLGAEFKPVHREALVLGIYEDVSPIDAASPATSGLLPPDTVFTVDLLQPLTNSVVARWFVNGDPAGSGTSFYFTEYIGSPFSIPNGAYEVKVVATDMTPLVRDDEARGDRMTDERVWFVGVGDEVCLQNSDCDHGAWCQKPDGQCDAGGVCTPHPFTCVGADEPVCGCNGYDYSSRCWAQVGGTSVARLGECIGVCCAEPCNPASTRAQCEAVCGVWLGSGTSNCGYCGALDLGACCLYTGTEYVCEEIYEERCNCLGGTFSGDGVRCASISCP